LQSAIEQIFYRLRIDGPAAWEFQAPVNLHHNVLRSCPARGKAARERRSATEHGPLQHIATRLVSKHWHRLRSSSSIGKLFSPPGNIRPQFLENFGISDRR
jgi:hypothetical protein